MSLQKIVNMDWQTSKMLQRQRMHKYLGYFVVITVQAAVVTGIRHRVEAAGNGDLRTQDTLIVANVLLFFGVLVWFEIKHQRILKTDIRFKTAADLEKSYSKQSFESEVASGCKLVILDNLVLDVS